MRSDLSSETNFWGLTIAPSTYGDMTQKRELGRQGTLTDPNKRESNEMDLGNGFGKPCFRKKLNQMASR